MVYALDEHLARTFGCSLKTLRKILHLLKKLRLYRNRNLGGDGRSSRPYVRREIAKGKIGLVSNSADYRNLRCRHRADNALFVESPQVFDRTAAASDNQHIGDPIRRCTVEEPNPFDDFLLRPRPLNLDRIKTYLQVRETPGKHGAHIMDHRPRG